MTKNNWVIIGCGGHARSVADVILYNNLKSHIVFFDEQAREDETILGFPVVSNFNVRDEQVIVGIGNNMKRAELSRKYFDNLSNVISKDAYVSRFSKLGRGIFIGHQAHIGILSEIDDYVVVNTKASVDHECKLGKGCFIGPNATLCGKVTVGESSFVGASAVIRDGVLIKSDIIIGAGSAVVKSLTEKGTYLGTPAHKLRKNKYK